MPLPHRTKLIIAFSAVYIIWGSTFFTVQLALKDFTPLLLCAFRLIIGATVLSIYCLIRQESIPSLSEIRKHALVGLFIFIGGMVAVVWSQQYISSSLASTIITTPFWFIILDKPQWKFYFSSKWIPGGLILSLIGVILLMSFKHAPKNIESSSAMVAVCVMVMALGSMMWVAGSLYLKYRPSAISVYVRTTIQLLSAGLFCLIISYFIGDLSEFSFSEVSMTGVWALLYLSIVSSLFTFLAFIWLIKVQPPAIVSTYSYVNPLLATLLGWAFANEHISAIQLLALFIILTGVLFVNIPKYLARG